jgi:hypothetical protein
MAGGRDMRAQLVAPAQKWRVPRRRAKRPDAAVRTTLRRVPRHLSALPNPVELKAAEIAEFLQAFALDLAAVDIPSAVDADEVEVVEFAKLMADATV